VRSARHAIVVLVALAACSWAATIRAESPRGPAVTIPDQFKDEDAVILDWEDSVQLGNDGSSTWHEKKRVMIQNDRAIGAFADPRITYNKDCQTVSVLVARTLCPDGRVVEVPKYARNEVSPRDTAGWPAFAPIRQLVLTFSAIEPGAILELEWELTSKPGNGPQEFEFVVKSPYPILERRVMKNGVTVHEAKSVNPLPEEAAGLTSRDRGAIVAISRSSTAKEWARDMLGRLESFAHVEHADLPIDDWTSGKADPLDKAAAIQEKLAAQLNVVETPPPWVPIERRSADTVWRSHYATPLEAAGLLLLCFRNAGLNCEPLLAVSSDSNELTEAAVSAFGVALHSRSGTSWWHTTQGHVRDPGPWGGWKRYDKASLESGDAEPPKFRLPDDSSLEASAVVTLDDKANYTAKLDLKLSGLFLNSALRTDEEKKAAINSVLTQLLPDAELGKFTVTSLSDSVFAVSAEAKSTKPLRSVEGQFFFFLPHDSPWTSRFEFPMGRSKRKTALRLAGPFEENISLELKIPEGWSAIAMPHDISHVVGTTASVNQHAANAAGRVTLTSTTAVRKRDLSPEDFAQTRVALSDAQTERARVFAFSPAAKNAKTKKID